MTTSEVSVSVTVDDARRLEAIVDNLRGFADVDCEREMAIICAVGENVHARSDGVRPSRCRRSIDSAADGVAGGIAPEHHVRLEGCRRAAGDDAAARGVLRACKELRE